jgi:hypothetical protein
VPRAQSPKVKLCKLDFEEYHKDPSKLPMNKDLVKHSCRGGVTEMTVSLDDIKKDIALDSASVIPPTGFVFHESRCGSTLVANILGADPQNLVFAESQPVSRPPLVWSCCC